MEGKRFKLERSVETPGWWVLTDMVNLVVVRFEEHKFFGTQKVSVLDDSKFTWVDGRSKELGQVMTDMKEYMDDYWYSIANPTPEFEIRLEEGTDKYYLIRHHNPRFTIELHDECYFEQFSYALEKAAEFIRKKYDK